MNDMSRIQADALARFLLTVRPDWSITYTADAVGRMRLIEPDLERIVRAAIRGALSPRIVKPDVLAMNGEHWKAQADFTLEPPRPGGRCQDCRGLHDKGSPCDLPPTEHEPYIAAMRDGLAQRRRSARTG